MTESIKYIPFSMIDCGRGQLWGYWDKMLWEIFWSTPWGYHWPDGHGLSKHWGLVMNREVSGMCCSPWGFKQSYHWATELNRTHSLPSPPRKPYLYYKSNEQYCIFNHDFKHFEGINKYKLWSITTDILILFNYLTQLCKKIIFALVGSYLNIPQWKHSR